MNPAPRRYALMLGAMMGAAEKTRRTHARTHNAEGVRVEKRTGNLCARWTRTFFVENGGPVLKRQPATLRRARALRPPARACAQPCARARHASAPLPPAHTKGLRGAARGRACTRAEPPHHQQSAPFLALAVSVAVAVKMASCHVDTTANSWPRIRAPSKSRRSAVTGQGP